MGGGSGGRDTCGRDQATGAGGGQTQAEPNGAGEGARPALQHLRLLLKLPHPHPGQAWFSLQPRQRLLF